MSKLFSLSRNERLKSRKDIEALFQHGKAFFIYPYKVLFIVTEKNDKLETLRFLATVPKKNFKKATARNRIRRKVKEAFRLQKVELKQTLIEHNFSLHVLFIYQANDEMMYEQLHNKMKECLSFLHKKLLLPVKDDLQNKL